MSYASDIRGALACVSGASRRVQALRELRLPEADELEVEDRLNECTEHLIRITTILENNGHSATAAKAIASSASRWREEVYGGRKPQAPAEAKVAADVSHPWRQE